MLNLKKTSLSPLILVDWTELQNEEKYRQQLRQEQEAREHQVIVWDDETERDYRQKYIEERLTPKFIPI